MTLSKKPLSPKPIKKQTLAEQMAESIRELILSGEVESTAALPTEPELAEQFGVSRAVVRDATRILMAQGLVEARQGLGVFVTQPQNEAFGDALLLALRRAGATVWDVEQFDQILFPEVVVLAATEATGEEIAEIRRRVTACIEVVNQHQAEGENRAEVPEAALEQLRAAFWEVRQAIFAATHNQILQQLARPLLKLRNLRRFENEGNAETSLPRDVDFLNQLMEAVASRDPDYARATATRLMYLPPEAIEAMRRTPVGEIPLIHLSGRGQA